MRTFIILTLVLTTTLLNAQSETNIDFESRNGLSFGLGLGAGTLSLQVSEQTTTNFSASLPNFKIGYAVSEKFSMMIYLPGAIYQFDDLDRGFEGIMLNGQYWLKDRWWINAGVGLTLDAPAFYTVDDFASANFYTGLPAIAAGTGYEIFKKGNFAIDLQYRIFIGKSVLENNSERAGVSNMFIVGFNLY